MDAGSEDLGMTSQLKVGSGLEYSPTYTGRFFVSLYQKLSLRERRAVPLEMLTVTLTENGRTLAFLIADFHTLWICEAW